jgi:hypothetical protein
MSKHGQPVHTSQVAIEAAISIDNKAAFVNSSQPKNRGEEGQTGQGQQRLVVGIDRQELFTALDLVWLHKGARITASGPTAAAVLAGSSRPMSHALF